MENSGLIGGHDGREEANSALSKVSCTPAQLHHTNGIQ